MRIEPLAAQDVPLVLPLARRAFDDLARRQDREPRPLDPAAEGGLHALHEHLRTTGHALVARDGDDLLGMALAYQRPHLWTLALLLVEPGRQSSGTGSALLRAVLAEAGPVRLLHATTDARALRAYSRAGFRLLPALQARGEVDRAALGDAPAVQDADLGPDLGPAEPVRADLEHLVAHGGRALALADGRPGLVTVHPPQPSQNVAVVHAPDDATAADLVRGALAVTPGQVELSPLAPQEHWAVPVALDARLELSACGPVCLAGVADPLAGPVPPPALFA